MLPIFFVAISRYLELAWTSIPSYRYQFSFPALAINFFLVFLSLMVHLFLGIINSIADLVIVIMRFSTIIPKTYNIFISHIHSCHTMIFRSSGKTRTKNYDILVRKYLKLTLDFRG